MNSPAFQFYPKQIMGDDKVLAMDWDARGMHFWLLGISWQQDEAGTIPDDLDLIRRWLGLPSGSDNDRVWARVKPQLLNAWPLRADGRRFNAGLVRTWESQQKRKLAGSQNVRIRYQPSTNGLVSPKKIEVETEVAVGFDLEEFDHEKAVREIQQAHPRPENSQANEIAVLEAIEHVVKERQCKRQEAAEWLLSRTEMYRLAVENWPDKQFITKSTRWFTSRSFEEDPQFWERKSDHGSKRDESRRKSQESIERAFAEVDRGTD